jgi:hypothetical protein
VSLLRHTALFVWELPQNVLGALDLAVCLLLRRVATVHWERDRIFVKVRGAGAVSLGLFVFWSDDDTPYVRITSTNKEHEFGHSIQSRMLGPLYLPLVGLPSTCRVGYAIAYRRLTGRRWDGYFRGYPEDWADRLANVDSTL